MKIDLKSTAENRAVKAEMYKCFLGVKVAKIKEMVKALLENIKSSGFFVEYTKHDITHIDGMIEIIEWLIPEETQESMTDAEWLMLVLSIYFHDLGMLITNYEFNNRNKSSFKAFKEKILYDKDSLYGKKLSEYSDIDKMLYQEFVRHNHAIRIRDWIYGNYSTMFGGDDSVIKEIQEVIKQLPEGFKRDMAKICESHHLNDLDDFNKYKVDAKYSGDNQCVVNLSYIAIILRTADLLHITSDRTPSIEFKVINPTDPKSILEWQKQSYVSAITPQAKLEDKGGKKVKVPSDTIEVTALFSEPELAEAYFGLSEYLNYAREQIKYSNEIVKKASKEKACTSYLFPWIDICEESIETAGFEKEKFEFTLNQKNILNLLVGHTLYNDTSVVLRELIQNAIDAIDVQSIIMSQDSLINGKINVKWNSGLRELCFEDNGTGMTLSDIKNYLLKVGSSKYESDEFKKRFSEFSSISRFGIGILTCFLVSDEVEIFTMSENEDFAISISLRHLHGKYLLQKLDKSKVNDIKRHGTILKLRVRPNIDMSKLEEEISKWILFPPCSVMLHIDDHQVAIGYKSPKEALEKYIKDCGYDTYGSEIKIKEKIKEGLSFAYAIQYNKYLNEWSFLNSSRFVRSNISPLGVCIKGVRVDFGTPGYNGEGIISTANFFGKDMPKTNVARSEFESISEKEKLLHKVYEIYSEHVQEQFQEISKKDYSVAWAIDEIDHLISPLISKEDTNDTDYIQSKRVLYDCLNKIDSCLLEIDNSRISVNVDYLKQLDYFYIVKGEMIRSAEKLLKEIKTPTTLTKLLETLGNKDIVLQNKIFTNYSSINKLHNNALKDKEVSEITIYREHRRVDFKYEDKNLRWLEISGPKRHYSINKYYIPMTNISFKGFIDNQIGIIDDNNVYFTKSDFIKDLNLLLNKFDYKNNTEDYFIISNLLGFIVKQISYQIKEITNIEKIFDNEIYNLFEHYTGRDEYIEKMWKKIDKSEIISLVNREVQFYNLSIWYRTNISKSGYYRDNQIIL